ncbi:MAG: 50S ribosomal protein L21 [SAR324 cluster bacterium]|nr:50S ribosomal protein L21 [SAR324 cluster bacterium]MBF0350581.1 50S ribosomal protein L21 [SAR324 cluster bacterium]
MYAIIHAGGRQVQVEAGVTVEVDRIQAEPGSAYENNQVLLLNDSGAIKVGHPVLDGVSVKGTIVEHTQDDKIRIFKRRRRKRYRKHGGHRQQKTIVKVESIQA